MRKGVLDPKLNAFAWRSIARIAHRACSAMAVPGRTWRVREQAGRRRSTHIAERDAHIAQEPAAFRAEHRRIRKTPLELVIVQRQEFNKIRPARSLRRCCFISCPRARSGSTDRQPGIHRNQKCECQSRAGVLPGSGLSVQSSGKMQRRASSSNGARIASVGHAAMQRVQLPQRFFSGGSGSISTVVMISLRRIQLPSFRLMRFVCLPMKPRPDRCARSRSSKGPVSTYQRKRAPIRRQGA